MLIGGLDAEGQLCLGGAVDALFTNRAGEYVLVDWKRTAKEFGPDEDTRFANPGTGPVRELLDSKYNRYSLQLAVYSGMLKSCMGIDVGDRRYLVRLSGADGAQQIDASGAVFDRVAEALLREAGVVAPEEAAPPTELGAGVETVAA